MNSGHSRGDDVGEVVGRNIFKLMFRAAPAVPLPESTAGQCLYHTCVKEAVDELLARPPAKGSCKSATCKCSFGDTGEERPCGLCS